MIYWDEALATEITVIDDDHKTLFGLLNNLQSASDNSEETWRVPMAIDALNDYAKDHFQREEALMLLSGYNALPRHQQEHTQFRNAVASLRELYGMCPDLVSLPGLNQYLKNWLMDHIAVSDHSYVSQMQAHQTLIDAASTNLMSSAHFGVVL